MHLSRRLFSSIALGCVATLTLTIVEIQVPAQASVRGSIIWSFATGKVDAGAGISVTFQSSGLRSGSLLTFERQFGTAKSWRAVAHFHVSSNSSSTATLPGDPLGAYEYRVKVTTGRSVIVLTHDRPLYVFGTVTLQTICDAGSSQDNLSCSPGSVQLSNSTLYNYQVSGEVTNTTSPGQTEFEFGNTSCQSGSLAVAVGHPSSEGGPFGTGSTATLQIAQSASDPQLVTIPDTSEQQFNFKLDGGPFDIDSWFAPAGNNNFEDFYASGTFSCYTLNGKA